jgi:hypothetical protein
MNGAVPPLTNMSVACTGTAVHFGLCEGTVGQLKKFYDQNEQLILSGGTFYGRSYSGNVLEYRKVGVMTGKLRLTFSVLTLCVCLCCTNCTKILMMCAAKTRVVW